MERSPWQGRGGVGQGRGVVNSTEGQSGKGEKKKNRRQKGGKGVKRRKRFKKRKILGLKE